MKKKYLFLLPIILLFTLTSCKKDTDKVIQVDNKYKITYEYSLDATKVKNNESASLLVSNENYHYNGVIVDKEVNSLPLINKKYTYFCITPGLLNNLEEPLKFTNVRTVDETTKLDYIGTDKKNYIALYTFKSDNEYDVIQKSDTEEVKGSFVYSLSNPATDTSSFDSFLTLKEGLLSTITDNYLSTSIPLNSNELGCPIFFRDGSFLGITSSIVDTNGDNDSIINHVVSHNKVVRYDYIYRIYEELKERDADIVRGVMGITVTNYDLQFTYNSPDGNPYVTIIKVTSSSPAANANIKPGMFVLEIDDKKVDRMEDLTYYMAFKNKNDEVKLRILDLSGNERICNLRLK